MPRIMEWARDRRAFPVYRREVLEVKRDLPERLHHYTTVAGLQGILTDRILRATNIAYLNDSTEYQYTLRLARRSIRERLEAAHVGSERRLFVEILNRLRDAATEIVQPIYVACFSGRADSLSQWRAYGGGEGGYALTFGAVGIRAVAKSVGNLWPCLYDRDVHSALIEEAIDAAKNAYLEHLDDPNLDTAGEANRPHARTALWLLARLAPVMKHPAFAVEDEWRVVIEREPDDFNDVQFTTSRNLLRPYLGCSLIDADTNRVPLERIRVGPNRHTDLCIAAVEQFLTTSGYGGVRVMRSSVPYREI